MTVAECVAEALHANADVRTSTDEEAVARAQRWEVGGQTLPRIHMDMGVQQWGSSYGIAFGSLGTFQFHDPFTWTFSVSAVQPITALLPLLEQYHVRDLGVDIAAIQSGVTRRDVAFRVIETYYRLLQAERLAEVAVQSVDQLEGQLKQANSFHDAGVVSRADVLRSELAVASAKQRVIQARAQVALGRSRLANVMGMSADASVDAIALTSDPQVTIELPLEQAELKAHADRIELRELEHRIEQSKVGVRIAWYKMAPQINLVTSYLHNDQVRTGVQFVEKDAVFVGGTLSWDVWDWGSSIAGVREANAKVREARTARDKVRDQLDLEVHEAFLNVGTATEATTVARAAVASAEENFRLVTKRYEANTATSFDVVDAENLLTQARAQLQTSPYDYLVARAALRRATGDTPEAQLR